MEPQSEHEAWMRQALAEAVAGAAKGNIAVGSLILKDGRVVARGHNEVVSGCDPTAHAEIVAIRRAATRLATPLLTGAILYTTLEPCPMCAAALVWARVEKVVIGAFFPLTGGVRSRVRVLDALAPVIHSVHVEGEVLPAECVAVLPPEYRAAVTSA